MKRIELREKRKRRRLVINDSDNSDSILMFNAVRRINNLEKAIDAYLEIYEKEINNGFVTCEKVHQGNYHLEMVRNELRTYYKDFPSVGITLEDSLDASIYEIHRDVFDYITGLYDSMYAEKLKTYRKPKELKRVKRITLSK